MDIYQLIVGEIGIPRREFLYHIKYWEVLRIIKGYRRRNWLTYQLLAENVFASTFAMRKADGMTPQKMFPELFKNEDDDIPSSEITEEDEKELQEIMNNYHW